MSDATRLSLRIPARRAEAPPLQDVATALILSPPPRRTLETASTALTDLAKTNAAAAALGCVALDRIRASRSCSPALSQALMRAGWWLQRLGEFLKLYNLELRAPHVTANADDEVVFEWWAAERKLTLYITSTKIDFVQVSGPNIVHDMVDGEITSNLHGTILWRWLVETER